MNVQFSARAWDEYLRWPQTDKKIVRKINDLIRDVGRDPLCGLGKPEPLKHAYAGYWSRRITEEHRFVYKVIDDSLIIVQVRYHYT